MTRRNHPSAVLLSHRSRLASVLLNLRTRISGVPRESPQWWQALRVAEADLRTLLEQEEALHDFRDERMRADGNGFSRLSLTSLVNWMMDRGTESDDVDPVSELEDYLARDTFRCRFSLGIRGVAFLGARMLADDVELLPNSADVAAMEAGDAPAASTAVLTTVIDYPKVILPFANSARLASPTAQKAADNAYEKLQTARMCIAIILNTRIVETVRVTTTLPEVPRTGGRSASRIIHPPNVAIRTPDGGQSAQIADFHARLSALPRKLKDRLVVALHRWHALFLDAGVSADFFIDLGIGLESVFVSERAPEIGYRLAIRGARLLGGSTPESRARMAKMLKILYEARSRGVHHGRLLENVPCDVAPSVPHLALDGEELLRRAIITMVYRGKDDWEELEFA